MTVDNDWATSENSDPAGDMANLIAEVKASPDHFGKEQSVAQLSALMPRPRYYLKASVVEAEELEGGRWRVTGRGWLANGVEFSDEDFRRNFEAL